MRIFLKPLFGGDSKHPLGGDANSKRFLGGDA